MTLQQPEGGSKSKKVYVVGNYRFSGKLLGKGNFARVEEAVHTILNVKVAVKVMDIRDIKEDYVIRNLFREAKLMAKLNHPCICALYQTMQRSDNVYYLVTELALGGDLCTFVKEQRGGRLDERPARIYARQFVSALCHMHQMGVVHRDLKMENVMLNSARTQIKIVDFGLSNLYNPNEPLKTHCGSPEYAAPELFVTGMKYGPEVDLWSLGIILYGMVVGQLPFVSNRSEQIGSQERRKRLVGEINKGLGTAHKRALAIFSPDFRNMINRMLVADSTKRISIRELAMHPFITEKGSKMVRTNPMKKLDLRHQAGIIAEICELTHQPSDQVIHMIKQEPLSRMGGMYNILSHRITLNRLNGDGITKAQPVPEVNFKGKSPQDSPLKRPYNLRNSSIKPPSSRGGDSYSPRTAVQDKKASPQHQSLGKSSTVPQTAVANVRPKTESRRPCTPTTGIRPRTVQSIKSAEKKVNYRDIRTPFMARKAYSAGITPKTTRPVTAGAPVINTRMATKDMNKKLSSLGIELKKTESNTKKSASTPLNGLKIILKPQVSNEKTSTGIERKQRSKSEKLPGTRPATTTTTSNVRKIVSTTQSDSKTITNRPQTTSAKETRPFSRLLKLARPASQGEPMEKSAVAAYGDIARKNQKTKKPTIYDPIARSIAGYVCNNVPGKMPNLSHFKK